MTIYPAIDLHGGKCVRLLRGDINTATIYGEPKDIALKWKNGGARWLHIVDLDGAFSGKGEQRGVVAEIVRETGLKVQLGGGIRNEGDVAQCIEEIGVSRVILGTAAAENLSFVKNMVAKYGDAIACGIDAKDGKVRLRGWDEGTDISAYELARKFVEIGVNTIIYTDIAQDGTLEGPNISYTARMAGISGLNVIGSGGIGRLSDIAALAGVGCAGVIIGKALYNNSFTFEQALKYEENI